MFKLKSEKKRILRLSKGCGILIKKKVGISARRDFVELNYD